MFHNSPSNWDQFWIALDTAILSGLIYSIVVAFIVNMLIQRTEQRAEARERAHAAERDVVAFKRRLRAALREPDYVSFTSMDLTMPPKARATAAITTGQPIELWDEVVAKHHVLFEMVAIFRARYIDYGVAANALDVQIRRHVRLYIHKQGESPSMTDAIAQGFVRGRILGYAADNILPMVACKQEDAANVEALYRAVCVQLDVAALIPPYTTSRSKLVQALIDLNVALDGDELLAGVTTQTAKRRLWNVRIPARQ